MPTAVHGDSHSFVGSSNGVFRCSRTAACEVPTRSTPSPIDIGDQSSDTKLDTISFLLAQLQAPPTIAELAHVVGTNAFRLKRDFKAVFARNIRAFVLAQRHEIARTLLLDTRLSIKEIAARIGYSDVAHFRIAFKRHQGVSPSVLRGRGRQERERALTDGADESIR